MTFNLGLFDIVRVLLCDLYVRMTAYSFSVRSHAVELIDDVYPGNPEKGYESE